MKTIKLFLICFGISSAANSQVEWDLFNTSIAQGVGEQKGLLYFCMSTEMGYRLPNSPLMINAFYSGGQFNKQTEALPMYTVDDGHGENVRVRSFGGIQSFGLRLRYSPEFFNERRFFPYIELGGGHARYRQRWNTRGELTPDATDDCPKYQHVKTGHINQSSTFFGSGEIGFMFQYPGKYSIDGKGAFFGFSVRYETGGTIRYADPSTHRQHFYYNSGLGDEFDRPFLNEPGKGDRGLYNIARHQQLIYKLTFLRIVF